MRLWSQETNTDPDIVPDLQSIFANDDGICMARLKREVNVMCEWSARLNQAGCNATQCIR